MSKLIVFSGIQPSGILTIGNYIGALSQWVNLQRYYKCIYCIADLHSLTCNVNKIYLNKLILDILALYLSCGINPNKSIIFVQSNVSKHTELFWILNCYTQFSEVNKIFKFKKAQRKNVNLGLFNYPVLMASDILLYQSNKIPVGDDQKQHVELTRNIANRFNYIYGNIFTLPEIILNKVGSRIMSLRNPYIKMSKSNINLNNTIYLLDKKELIIKKIKSAFTDSDKNAFILYDPINKPGISNLLNILSSLTLISIDTLEKFFKNKMYCYFKNILIDALLDFINPLQEKYNIFRLNEYYLFQVINNGSKQANIYANNTLINVFKKLDLFFNNF